jgi:hypothetical protein
MVKKLSVLYGTSNFITEFTAARQWTLNVRSTRSVLSARVWADLSWLQQRILVNTATNFQLSRRTAPWSELDAIIQLSRLASSGIPPWLCFQSLSCSTGEDRAGIKGARKLSRDVHAKQDFCADEPCTHLLEQCLQHFTETKRTTSNIFCDEITKEKKESRNAHWDTIKIILKPGWSKLSWLRVQFHSTFTTARTILS